MTTSVNPSRIFASPGITYTGGVVSREELDQKMASLQSRLSSDVALLRTLSTQTAQSTASNTSYITQVYQTQALGSRLDRIQDVDLINPAITDGTMANTVLSNVSGTFLSLSGGGLTLTDGAQIGGNLTVYGTLTPGVVSATSSIAAPYFTATSTTATSTIAGSFAVGTSTPSGSSLFTIGTSSTLFYVDKITGRVGIGTSNPSVAFNVQPASGSGDLYALLGRNNYDATARTLVMAQNDAGKNISLQAHGSSYVGSFAGVSFANTVALLTGTGPSAMLIGENSLSSPIYLGHQSAIIPAITILQGSATQLGSVGIGTTTPGATFSIAGNAGQTKPIFLLSSSTSAFATSTVASIDSNGNALFGFRGGKVGIGTTDPQAQLHVTSAASTDATIIIDSTSVNVDSYLSLREAGVEKWKVRNQGDNNDALKIGNPDNTHFLVLKDGKFGFNVTVPSYLVDIQIPSNSTAVTSDSSALNIANAATSTTSSINKTGLQISSTGTWSGTSASNIGLYVSSVTGGTNNYDAIFNGGGNVGIGTTTPWGLLSVNPNALGGTIPSFVIGSSTATRFIVDGAGNVGIGTTTPFGLLSVEQGTETSSFWIGNTGSTTPSLVVSGVNGNGNVGIGTSSPGQTLSVVSPNYDIARFTKTNVNSSAVYMYGDTQGGGLFSGSTASGSGIYLNNITKYTALYTNDAEKMRIVSSGNLGIGSSTPSNLLSVQGGGYIGNNLFVGGTITSTSSSASTFPYASTTAISSTGSAYFATSGTGLVGIGTTTPWGLLSVNPNALGAGVPEFVIGSTTATHFIVDGAGNVGIGTTTLASTLTIHDTTLAGSGSLTGSALSVAQTWNTSGTATAFKVNVTDTASANASSMADFQRNGVSQFRVSYQNSTVRLALSNASFIDASTVVNGGMRVIGNQLLQLGSLTTTASIGNLVEINNTSSTVGPTSGTVSQAGIVSTFGPTSGTSVFNLLNLTPTINQTGGANGITRGIYLDPTITAATDYRSIEVTKGNVLFNTTSGSVGIGTSTPNWLLQQAGTRPFHVLSDTSAGTNAKHWFTSSQGGNFYMGTSSDAYATTTYMTILNGGYVGVGTTSPTEQLSVAGRLYVGGVGTSTVENNLYVKGTLRSTVSYVGDLVFANNFRFVESPSVTQALVLNNQNDVSLLSIDENGNVGIGTTSPAYKLHVMGDIAATSFVNISTRSSKKDILYVGDEDKRTMVDRLRNIRVAEYRYNTEGESAPLRLGLIAEEAPVDVLSASGKGVDVYKLATFILVGVQAQQKRLDDLELRVAKLESAPSGGTSLMSLLNSIGAIIESGIAHFKNMIADAFTVGSKEKPAGITLYNRSGQPYCLTIGDSGEPLSTLGVCTPSISASSNEASVTEAVGSSGGDTTAPIITIIGNNPAEIVVGASYGDLGATVTDNVSTNLGYRTFVNDTLVTGVSLDTGTTTMYRIDYVATDGAGNTATTTRTVHISAPASTDTSLPAGEESTTTESSTSTTPAVDSVTPLE